jgi:nitroimidazol reductase NimA-like FMN-containing flavoprotein (pyridoxamine 5'-phosphate oxidase superfamily)
MIGQLTNEQIDTLLISCVVGHLGCCSDNTPYVIPIAYAYDGIYIYSHAREGTKIDFMRKNPQVCLEIDQIDNLSNWRSVMVWGSFEELKGEAAETAMQLLKNRLYPLKTSFYSQSLWELTAKERGYTKETKEVLYRIRITQKTGRFEKE